MQFINQAKHQAVVLRTNKAEVRCGSDGALSDHQDLAGCLQAQAWALMCLMRQWARTYPQMRDQGMWLCYAPCNAAARRSRARWLTALGGHVPWSATCLEVRGPGGGCGGLEYMLCNDKAALPWPGLHAKQLWQTCQWLSVLLHAGQCVGVELSGAGEMES